MKGIVESVRERKLRNGDEGFTLIELLIVIVVLGILAAVVVVSVVGLTGKSAISACESDAKAVETAIASYNANNSPGIAVGNPSITDWAPGASNDYAPLGIQSLLVRSDTNQSGTLVSWPHNPDYYFITVNQDSSVSIVPGGNKEKNPVPFTAATGGAALGTNGCQQVLASN